MVEAHEEVEEFGGRVVEGFGDGRDGAVGEAVGGEDGVDERVRLAGGGADESLGLLDGNAVGVAVQYGSRLAGWLLGRMVREGDVLFTLGAYEAT